MRVVTKKMSNIDNITTMKKIEIDRNHIENFPMETTEGTKRTKEKFYRNAVEQLNKYIDGQLSYYQDIKKEIEMEFSDRLKKEMPVDKTEIYNKDLKELDCLLDLVKLNSDISNSFKLKIDFIIASINEEASLETLNLALKKFVERFKELGIILTIDDFKYTMFTEQYMSSFFKDSSFELLKDTFEKIYFACPDIKLQLKMNLSYIVQKYNHQLNKYVESYKEKLFLDYSVNSNTVIEKYTSFRYDLGNRMASDEFYNTTIFTSGKKKIQDFIENSPARIKNYNMFVSSGDYNSLNDDEKENFDSAVMGFYLTLNELKKYYNYEFMLSDLLEQYKNKDSIKGQYAAKKKEIDKEEKNRLSLYKNYLKACGVGFLAKKNDNKRKDFMLKMNEQIKKLHSLYEELDGLEIGNQMLKLNDSSSIYDVFSVALSSFPFLEKSFLSTELFEDKTLEENVDDYYKFIYNPNNRILRKINVFTDYDIISIVAEKYKLLNLAVTNEMVDQDNIDSTMESVKYINLIQNINRSNITLHQIENICRIIQIVGNVEEVDNDLK